MNMFPDFDMDCQNTRQSTILLVAVHRRNRLEHQSVGCLIEELKKNGNLILQHLERPKLYTILAFLSAIGVNAYIVKILDKNSMEFQLSVYKLPQNRVKLDTQQTFTSPMLMTLEQLKKNGDLTLLHLARMEI